MLSVVKMPLKGKFGGHALNNHGNYIVDHGKSLNNNGIIFLNFCGTLNCIVLFTHLIITQIWIQHSNVVAARFC